MADKNGQSGSNGPAGSGGQLPSKRTTGQTKQSLPLPRPPSAGVGAPQTVQPRIVAAHSHSLWRLGLRTAVRRFLYIAVPTLVWMLLAQVGALSPAFVGNSRLIISALLFVLAIPTSIILRIDSISESWGLAGYHQTVVFIALAAVGLNFVAIGALSGWLKSRLRGPSDNDGPRLEPKDKTGKQ